MQVTNVLKELMLLPALSGYEKEVANKLQEEFLKYTNEVVIDKLGNTMAKFEGSDEKSPTIMVYAHMDQLGFIIRRIDHDGYIQVERLGGIPEKVLPGLNVLVSTTEGKYFPGVIGNKSHHITPPEEKYKVDAISSLYIDIGAVSDEEVRSMGIEIGCPVIYKPNFQELAGSKVSGTSIDNRGGVAALVHIAILLKQQQTKSTVYLVGTVWEEFNLRGATIAARECNPDVAIALDVVLTGDTPDMKNRFEVSLGKGPAMMMYNFHGRGTLNGTIPHKGLTNLALLAAREMKIPLQYFAGVGILTDSSYVQLEGDGIAALELGFPTRYTHTPIEVCDVKDIEKLGVLVNEIAQRMDSSFDLHRF
ncbi:MAG: M42 family metallopeptidase [Ruminiclostridium sp.]